MFEEEGTISFQINAFVIDKYILKNKSYDTILNFEEKKKVKAMYYGIFFFFNLYLFIS